MTRPDVEVMRDLLARVKAATGPDREIDARIHHALFPDQEVMLDGGVVFGPGPKRPPTYGALREFPIEGWEDYDGPAGAMHAHSYTASIDAAVALFDRVLPKWSRESGRSGFGNPAWCRAWNPMRSPGQGNDYRADHDGGLEPHAICACALTGLIAAEGRDHG